jgi:hypothetical protein
MGPPQATKVWKKKRVIMGRVWREADPAKEREEREREREGKEEASSRQLQRTRNLRPKHRTKTRDQQHHNFQPWAKTDRNLFLAFF